MGEEIGKFEGSYKVTINFILMAVDQVVNHASKIHYMFGGQARVPMVIRTPSGGIGQLGATHSQSFENWFAYCPGIKVVAPATPYDAKGLLRASIRDDDPVLFIESLPLYDTKGDVPEGDYTVPIGVAEVKREGTDVTVIGYSRMTFVAMQVAEKLAKEEGISVEVVDLRSLRPLDRPTIVNSIKKTNRAVIIEEDWRSYGIGAEVAATIQEEAFDYLDAPVLRVAGLEVPLPYAEQLSKASKPSAPDLVDAIHKVLRGSKRLIA
jgi:pyruvate dehydrogenase E1 component beta subunit